jgi:hypothetical protein
VIVSARQKPVDQLPDWALCCEIVRQAHIVAAREGRILRVDTATTFLAEAECCHCHVITQNVKYIDQVDGPGGMVIAIDLHDLDEGESVGVQIG